MKDAKSLALVGAALLFVGVFLPLVSLPIVGSINYVHNGRGDGMIVLALAVISAVLAIMGKTRHVLWPGIAGLGVMTFTFIRLQSVIAEMKSSMDVELADNPFRGLADMALQSIQIQWGWAVLVLGAVLIIVAGWTARRSENGESDGATA